MDDKQSDKFGEAVEKKNEEALKQGHEKKLENPAAPDPREKSSRHGKVTADKWNQ